MIIWDLTNIYGGDVRYMRSRFPDGQPHIQVLNRKDLKPDDGPIEIITNIKSAEDIVELGMALSIWSRWVGYNPINVTIGYLMGARMDRPIDENQPGTLDVIKRMLRGIFEDLVTHARVLDAHSSLSLDLGAVNSVMSMTPQRLWSTAIAGMTNIYDAQPMVVGPDKGAFNRYGAMGVPDTAGVATCEKHRDPQTGKLSGFKLVAGDVKDKHCLIVDDICDGGGTFVGISKVLREAGAKSVSLCVTHGLFTKGLPLEGIDHIWTTDTVCHLTGVSNLHVMHNYLLDEVKSWSKP